MRPNLKKISIAGLAAIFLISMIACCCLTNTVEAQEPVPSCHQTTQDTESSQSTEECDCEQSLAMVKETTPLKASFLQIATISLDQSSGNYSFISTKTGAYQAPPQFYDTSPLYIKHSTLRI